MKALARFVRLAAALLALAATGAQAGGPISICNDAGKTPLAYSPPIVNLNYDMGNLGSRTKSQADTIVTNAVALWTNVGTATITIGRGADLPVDVNTANYLPYYNTFNDGLNPVIYDSDGSIVDLILGTNQKNIVLGFAGSAFFSAPQCRYAEGRAVINGFINVTDATMSVVIAHEIGHLIGLDHTQLDSTQGLAQANYPLMYPIAARTTATLHEDEVAAVSALYPDATLNSVYGQISGTFVLADGVTPVRGANLWATETTTNKVYSIVSDYLTQNTGFFKLLLPAGTYNLRAEAIQSGFTGGSGVGPYTDAFPTDPSFQPPLYVGGVPMATVTLGNAIPTSIVINAGCAATLTFRIDGTGSIGGNCPGSVSSSTLTVTKSGTGSGTVTSTPAGINCGATCSASFTGGALVNLTATPAAGNTFVGWSGACSGTGTCTVTMSSAMSVMATFAIVTLPAAPTIVAVTGGNASVSVSFTPGAIGSGTLVNYTATCNGTNSVTASANGTSSPITVSVPNGAFYTCVVRTTSTTGPSAWSAWSNWTTTGAAVTLPAAPSIGTATGGNASVSVAFTPGAIGSGTLVNYTATCNGTNSVTASANGTSSPITVSVPNGASYTCVVRTTSTAGTGPWSAWSNWATTSAQVLPAAPSIGTATGGNASVSVAFTPGAIGSGTLVNYTATCNGTNSVTASANGTSSPITVSVPNGASYTCVVRTTSTAGTGAWSAWSNWAPTSAQVLPAAPSIGTATGGIASVSVAFTPGAIGSGTLVNYNATCNGLNGVTVNANGTSSPIVVSGLPNSVYFTCVVRTTSTAGPGAWSAWSNWAITF